MLWKPGEHSSPPGDCPGPGNSNFKREEVSPAAPQLLRGTAQTSLRNHNYEAESEQFGQSHPSCQKANTQLAFLIIVIQLGTEVIK